MASSEKSSLDKCAPLLSSRDPVTLCHPDRRNSADTGRVSLAVSGQVRTGELSMVQMIKQAPSCRAILCSILTLN